MSDVAGGFIAGVVIVFAFAFLLPLRSLDSLTYNNFDVTRNNVDCDAATVESRSPAIVDRSGRFVG